MSRYICSARSKSPARRARSARLRAFSLSDIGAEMELAESRQTIARLRTNISLGFRCFMLLENLAGLHRPQQQVELIKIDVRLRRELAHLLLGFQIPPARRRRLR